MRSWELEKNLSVYLFFTLGSKLFVNIPGIQADPF